MQIYVPAGGRDNDVSNTPRRCLLEGEGDATEKKETGHGGRAGWGIVIHGVWSEADRPHATHPI